MIYDPVLQPWEMMMIQERIAVLKHRLDNIDDTEEIDRSRRELQILEERVNLSIENNRKKLLKLLK